jgi:hypothetical protein
MDMIAQAFRPANASVASHRFFLRRRQLRRERCSASGCRVVTHDRTHCSSGVLRIGDAVPFISKSESIYSGMSYVGQELVPRRLTAPSRSLLSLFRRDNRERTGKIIFSSPFLRRFEAFLRKFAI